MDLLYWKELLRPIFSGRKVIIAMQVAGGATQSVRDVLSLGATEVLVVATNGIGLGVSPTEAGAKLIVLNTPVGPRMVDSILACQEAVRHLPEWAQAEIEAFDPTGEAIALGDFLTETDNILGRSFVFHRKPEWIALDDKTTVDALWDHAGLERSPSLVVSATLAAVDSAFGHLDRGDGVVVAIDSRDGWTGGAEGTRWIRTRAEIPASLVGWDSPGRMVRVMPFIEGVPCSIHGIVFDDEVIALRPMEMVVLRKHDSSFFYAGCASYFDPPRADREAMRNLTKRVGAQLRSDVGFRGAFTVDGILSSEGFRPTELNPRNGAGLITMARATDETLSLLIDCIASGMRAPWRVTDLEHTILDEFDRNRAGGTWRSIKHVPVATDVPPTGRVIIRDENVRLVGNDEPADLTFISLLTGNSLFVRANWVGAQTPQGPYTAPRAAAFWNWLDTTYDLGIGALSPANSAR